RAGDVGLAGELGAGRRKLLHGAIVESKLLQPPVRVLAAIAPRRAARPAHGEVDFSPGLIKLFADLRTRLGTAYHQNRALRQHARIAVGVGMKLHNVGRKTLSESRDIRLLIESRRNHHVARHEREAVISCDDVAAPAVIAPDPSDAAAVAHGKA